jgi:membrane-bound ClpP family serine protease
MTEHNNASNSRNKCFNNIETVPVKRIFPLFERRMIMKLTAPKTITFWIAVILGVLGLLGQVAGVAFLAPYAFWLEFVGLVLLVLGLLIKGL